MMVLDQHKVVVIVFKITKEIESATLQQNNLEKTYIIKEDILSSDRRGDGKGGANLLAGRFLSKIMH